MKGAAIACRPRSTSKGKRGCLASSAMLLDCAKLKHWRCEEQFNELFEFKRDYMDWMFLKLEPRETMGMLEAQACEIDDQTERDLFGETYMIKRPLLQAIEQTEDVA